MERLFVLIHIVWIDTGRDFLFQSNYFILTKREQDVFQLLLAGLSTKEVTATLDIREKTMRNHISNAIQKLGVSGRKAALEELVRLGEIQ